MPGIRGLHSFRCWLRRTVGAISDAELTGDQVGELDVDPAEHAITIGMQWLCRNAADIALIHVERGENAQLERNVAPASA